MSKLQFHTSDIINYNDVMRPLIEKFRKGDHITDLEVRQLLTHFMNLEKHLFAEGERFHHAWRDISDQVRRLVDMQNARRSK